MMTIELTQEKQVVKRKEIYSIPGDKSITHRSILIGALAKNTSRFKGVLLSDDCLNTIKIVQSLGTNKVIFLPDDFLAKYVASQTDVEIISWKGTCEVHEQFNDDEINEIRKNNPGIKIIAHPECPPDVIRASDFAGSTSGMIKYVKDNQPKKVMMVTECSMSDNVQIDNPNVEFVRPCNLCPHMKRITLPKILDCLENETNELIMDEETIEKARKSVERMTEIGR